jgi:uncharacterized protein
MSKPDAAGAKSLEEILASIRKSLAGDGGDASTAPRAPGRTPMPKTPEGEPLADDGDGDGQLSARLAGALNGPTNGAALDDDFMELLAPDDKKTAPPDAASTGKAADARSEGKDPLWFLRQPSGAGQSNGSQAQAARTQPAEGAPLVAPAATPQEEVKLSRPEVLRASLPPLFGAETEQSPLPRTPPPEARKPEPSVAAPPQPQPAPVALNGAGKAAPDTPLTARTQPSTSPSQPVGEAGKPVPETEAAPALPAREPTLFRESAPAKVAEAAPAPQPDAEVKLADAPVEEALADTAAKPAPTPVQDDSPATKPAPAAEAPPPRTMEQVIGDILDPLIRQWLDANLPRLVEKVVRDEVARAVAAEPRTPKA